MDLFAEIFKSLERSEYDTEVEGLQTIILIAKIILLQNSHNRLCV